MNMKLNIKLFSILSLMVISIVGCKESKDPDIELVEKYIEVTNEGNKEGLLDIISEDFLFVYPPDTITYRDFINKFYDVICLEIKISLESISRENSIVSTKEIQTNIIRRMLQQEDGVLQKKYYIKNGLINKIVIEDDITYTNSDNSKIDNAKLLSFLNWFWISHEKDFNEMIEIADGRWYIENKYWTSKTESEKFCKNLKELLTEYVDIEKDWKKNINSTLTTLTNQYMEMWKNNDINGVIDLLYPKLIDYYSPSMTEFALSMVDAFMDIEVHDHEITEISEPVREMEQTFVFVRVKYQSTTKLKGISSLLFDEILSSFQSNRTVQVKHFDKQLSTIVISSTDDFVWITESCFDNWKTVRVSFFEENLDQVLSEHVLERYNEFKL